MLAAPELLAGLTGSTLADEHAGREHAGRSTGDQAAEAAARIAGSLEPATDVHASGDYRRRLVRVLTARALREAYARAAGAAA